MKRLVYLLLVTLIIGIVALSGCASEKSPAATTTAPGATATQPRKNTAPSRSYQAAGKTIELRFATFIPPTDVYAVTLGEWAKDLEQRTNGRVKVTFYHGQSLLKVPELLDGVASGTADMAFMFAGAYP